MYIYEVAILSRYGEYDEVSLWTGIAYFIKRKDAVRWAREYLDDKKYRIFKIKVAESYEEVKNADNTS